jgi:hypothetical protein
MSLGSARPNVWGNLTTVVGCAGPKGENVRRTAFRACVPRHGGSG